MQRTFKIILSFLFVIILLLGFTVPVNMVGNWYQQFIPNIGSQQINDIVFIDSLNGYAVASRNVNPDTARILKTTNGGDNWQTIYTLGSRRFSKIKFINANTGFVCGGTGTGTPYIYKTSNSGINWSVLDSIGCAFWSDMYVLNNDTIWIVDSDGLCGGVFLTTTGGVNWIPQYYQFGNNPSRIYMFNARIGFINFIGNFTLKRTTDGGGSWNQINGENGFLDIKFVDSLTGWKCNNINGTPYFDKTTNGGLNWFNQILPYGGIIITTSMTKLSILNRDTVWGTGGQVFYGSGRTRGTIYRTTNGGDTWLFQIPDTGFGIEGYYSIQFINKNTGWCFGARPVNIFTNIHTTTGGDTEWLIGLKQTSTEIPKEFKLYQNYPNPFNSSTVISYQLTVNSFVRLIVYDMTGKEIVTLISQKQAPGTYETDFNGTNYSSGVYFYKLIVTGEKEVFTETRKMIMVK
jgi:photosystem II stability/assembly factor-like uncharacterized protein